ncbi:uncharacterized protein BJ171DRAFT_521568 [Polychytrium aggregatum]|uniref:uncharacterized protein n=1 Tax=Polychytrium aggregatum TaxID=110093 RepID=UPI0022FDE105|nr:uncharacterized protein BJ171DRAFT_521568 [Polychytrium aggregatum]KAI9197215.1 hypothetical protein BJ171DRAFT_521568 [Polychytrium aggregatum]
MPHPRASESRPQPTIDKAHSIGSTDIAKLAENTLSSDSLVAPKHYPTAANISSSQLLDASLRQFTPYMGVSSCNYAPSELTPTKSKSIKATTPTTRSQQLSPEVGPRRPSRSSPNTQQNQDDDMPPTRSPRAEDINNLRMQIQGLQHQLDNTKQDASTHSTPSSLCRSAAEKPTKPKHGLLHKLRRLFTRPGSKHDSKPGSLSVTDSEPTSVPTSVSVPVRGSDRV